MKIDEEEFKKSFDWMGEIEEWLISEIGYCDDRRVALRALHDLMFVGSDKLNKLLIQGRRRPASPPRAGRIPQQGRKTDRLTEGTQDNGHE